MSTKILCFVSLLLVLSGSAFARSSNGEFAAPQGAQLEKYPLEGHQLSLSQQAELGLKPVRLETAWTGYNHYRGLRGGRWVLETLPAGTIVLADKDGNPVYKADCGNRLVALAKCPACGTASIPAGSHRRGFWDRHPNFRNFLEHLGLLCLALLGIFLLLLLLLFLWTLLRRIYEELIAPFRGNPGPTRATATSSPASPSSSGAPPPDPSASGSGAPGGRQNRYVAFYHGEGTEPHKVNFGGHRHVSVNDHGDGKFTINFR